MARPLGSGPVHVYLGFGPPALLAGQSPIPGATPVTAAGAVYYGTTRDGPDVTEELSYYPVMNDLTGPRQSMDEGYAGREDTISLVMSSWTQSVDNALEQFLLPAGPIATRGTDALSGLGTLMVAEGKTLGLWLVKAAATKVVNIAAGMPLGRYYFCTINVGPNRPVEGNKENLRIRVFRAKKNIWGINNNALPLFSEDNITAGFTLLPAPTFG